MVSLSNTGHLLQFLINLKARHISCESLARECDRRRDANSIPSRALLLLNAVHLALAVLTVRSIMMRDEPRSKTGRHTYRWSVPRPHLAMHTLLCSPNREAYSILTYTLRSADDFRSLLRRLTAILICRLLLALQAANLKSTGENPGMSGLGSGNNPDGTLRFASGFIESMGAVVLEDSNEGSTLIIDGEPGEGHAAARND